MTDQPLFDMPEYAAANEADNPELSAGARLTAHNRAMLMAGKNPATGLLLIDTGEPVTCGDCAHHVTLTSHRPNQNWHKCTQHRLGISRSANSDIRISWPACELFAAAPDPLEGSDHD